MATLGPQSRAVLAQMSEVLGVPPEERNAAFLSALGNVPGAEVGSLLVEIARNLQADAVPLLEALLEDQRYVLPAIDALGLIPSESVVPVLRSIEASGRSKDVVKAARRSLHRLRSRGVKVGEAAPVQSPEKGLPGGRRIIRSVLASIDGAGDRLVSLLVSAPLAGMRMVGLLINDTQGIRDASGGPYSKRDFEEDLEKLGEGNLAWAEVPFAYVCHCVLEAEAINRETGNPLPSEYHIYRSMFEAGDQEHERPIVYDEIDAEALRSDPTLTARAKELLESRIFVGWLMLDEEIAPYAGRVMEAAESTLVLSEAAQAERIERIIKSAEEELFTPEVHARYKRRLEENAYILLRNGQPDLARVAVACALQLAPDGPPPPQIPFVEEYVKRSIAVYAARQQRDRRIQRVES